MRRSRPEPRPWRILGAAGDRLIVLRNCADFARGAINFCRPGALRRSTLADAGITTPKHAAKPLASYGRRRPEPGLSCFLIPEVPGSRFSRPPRPI
jgi:hypothetical protein